jgi:hypothetical protein
MGSRDPRRPPDPPSAAGDTELLAALRAGDRAAVGELYRRHRARVAAYLVRRTVCSDDVGRRGGHVLAARRHRGKGVTGGVRPGHARVRGMAVRAALAEPQLNDVERSRPEVEPISHVAERARQTAPAAGRSAPGRR